jgi:hypothetical protein
MILYIAYSNYVCLNSPNNAWPCIQEKDGIPVWYDVIHMTSFRIICIMFGVKLPSLLIIIVEVVCAYINHKMK